LPTLAGRSRRSALFWCSGCTVAVRLITALLMLVLDAFAVLPTLAAMRR
jgi:hypothetical protein